MSTVTSKPLTALSGKGPKGRKGSADETNGGQERGYRPGKAAVDECVSSDRLRTEGGRPI